MGEGDEGREGKGEGEGGERREVDESVDIFDLMMSLGTMCFGGRLC